MQDELKKALSENAALRETLAKIGVLVDSLGSNLNLQPLFSREYLAKKLAEIERERGKRDLASVEVAGEIYTGKITNPLPLPDYPNWVEVEVANLDPTAARMCVVGPIVGAI